VIGRLVAEKREGVGLNENGVPEIAWCKVNDEPSDDQFIYQNGEKRKLGPFIWLNIRLCTLNVRVLWMMEKLVTKMGAGGNV
jgi:hypothetical protein